MAKKKTKKKTVSRSSKSKKKSSSRKKRGVAAPVIGLLLNVIIFPGLGSLVGGKTKEGIWQMVLTIVGIILSIVFIGIPILIAVWIWGLITGVRMIQEATS